MPKQGQTRKQAMRALRQDDMRERIVSSNLLTDVLDISAKLAALADTEPSNATVGAMRTAADIKLRLLSKVLPDLRSDEISLESDHVVVMDMTGFKGAEKVEPD